MSQLGTNEIRGGNKVEVDGQPYVVISNEFVKPGKGQAFNRIRLKHITTGRTLERTFKSGEKLVEADVREAKMRMLYTDNEGAIFMDDNSFEQFTISFEQIGDNKKWLKEDLVYDLIFYKGEAVAVEPPTFLELEITHADPGARGDTASGRVLKPATTETGAEIQVPIFIDQGEVVKVDTRTGEYVSRAGK